MLKLAENPPMRPPTCQTIRELAGPWWVAHTKARAEKAFAWDLVAAGISYFLPLVRHTSFSGGRKRLGMLPLFPSYVFFSGGEMERYRALTTHRLCQVIAVTDQAQLIAELASLERALDEGAAMTPLYAFAVKGRRCRVARVR